MKKFEISDRETLAKVLGWVRANRGLKLWRTQDLSNCSAPDWLTPGDADQRPHWAYGLVQDLDPSEVFVEVRRVLDKPPEWYPPCKYCDGTGKRTFAAIAAIRGETLEEAREGVIKVGWKQLDEDHFECRSCSGCGHDIEPLLIAMKRYRPFEGGGLHPVQRDGSKKLHDFRKKMAAHYKLPLETVHWDYHTTWDFSGRASGDVYFYVIDEPTTLDKLV